MNEYARVLLTNLSNMLRDNLISGGIRVPDAIERAPYPNSSDVGSARLKIREHVFSCAPFLRFVF